MDSPSPTSSKDSRGYSAEQARKLKEQVRELRNKQPSVQLELASLADQLTASRARTFTHEGLGRRLPVIERAILNIYRIFPPDRQEFLTRDECTDVAIQLHAIAINLYALFDNIAWVCLLEAGQQLSPMKIGLFKPECQAYIPASLREYLAQLTVQTWFHDYGKLYRDSTAHRIAPYLPSRAFSPGEGERWQQLDQESLRALLDYQPGEPRAQQLERLARHEQLEIEKESLGMNSLLVGLSLTGEDASPPVYLHPQLLCDWGLAHELLLAFTKAMRQQYGWKTPNIPPMVVN